MDLCELIFINAKNNKRINNLEKYIVSKLKGISKKDIKTISEYEADVKSYSEKTYNKKIFSNNKSDKTPKVRTRFHNINESFRNYAPDELEKVIIESQKAKGLKSDNPIHNLYEIAIEHGLKKLPSPMSVENVINYAKENNLEIPKFDTSY